MSAFPNRLRPPPTLALLVTVAVPAAAAPVTLFAPRGVVIEPLGVVRGAQPLRRRLGGGCCRRAAWRCCARWSAGAAGTVTSTSAR